jgi:hypothetical protein
MSEAVKKFLAATFPSNLPKGELIVVSPPQPSAQELLVEAQNDHEEVERAAQTAVQMGIAAGKKLLAAKKNTPHGFFEEAVAAHTKLAMGTVQKYMRLARREPQLLQIVAQKRSLGLHLTMREAEKFIRTLIEASDPFTAMVASCFVADLDALATAADLTNTAKAWLTAIGRPDEGARVRDNNIINRLRTVPGFEKVDKAPREHGKTRKYFGVRIRPRKEWKETLE